MRPATVWRPARPGRTRCHLDFGKYAGTMPIMASIDDQLRSAIDRDPRSRYAISKVSGIDQGVISRMMHGARVNTATADALAEALDMEIVLKRKSRKVAGRGKRR